MNKTTKTIISLGVAGIVSAVLVSGPVFAAENVGQNTGTAPQPSLAS